MNDYLSKPLDRQQLFAVIAKWTEPRPFQDAARNGHAAPFPDDSGTGPASLTPGPPSDEALLRRIPGLDVDEGLYRLGGKPGIYRSILAGFAASGREYLGQMRQAMAQGLAVQARDVAHKLAGAAGNISAVEVRDLAWAMEESLDSGRLEEAEVLLESLARAMEAVAGGIEGMEAPERSPAVPVG